MLVSRFCLGSSRTLEWRRERGRFLALWDSRLTLRLVEGFGLDSRTDSRLTFRLLVGFSPSETLGGEGLARGFDSDDFIRVI